MEQKLNLNPLPVLTWNRLQVNSGNLSAPEEICHGSEPEMKELPAGISVEKNVPLRKALERIAAQGPVCGPEKVVAGKVPIVAGQDLPTGLGAEADDYLLRSGIRADCYSVAAGVKQDTPVDISIICRDGEAGAGVQIIEAGEDSESTFLIHSSSEKTAAGFHGSSTKILLAPGAVVHLVKVQMLGRGFRLFSDVGAVCREGSRLDYIDMQLGGQEAFSGCTVTLAGDGSSFDSKTGYLCRGQEKLDLNYHAIQTGRKTESRMQTRGVVTDSASKVFRGTIDFRSGSSGSKGDERENVLLLSDHAVNRTVPLILCEEEDVDGEHGATIGRLTEDVLFYAESRGIPRAEAERMMIRAQLLGISKQIPDRPLNYWVGHYIEEALV